VHDVVDWLTDRPYYRGQVTDRRVRPGQPAQTTDVDLEPRLASALADAGIDEPYVHQAQAIDAVRDGRNAVLATPTASGKSLAYTVPAFERAMTEGKTTLYVAPQVALINDQHDTLDDLAQGLGFGSKVRVAQYTGRLSQTEKEAVRDRQPTVLLVTPDMLHYGVLPHAHRLWDWFVERLDTVVVDEVHEYRGVFGSHVALVFRRLARVCERFGADPDWLCCSATIGNPVAHAATVTGQPESSFALVDDDASASGPRHWLCWNPPKHDDDRGQGDRVSNHVEAKRLFVDLVAKGLQTVVFTRSRQTAERYATESADALRDRGEDDLASRVGAYQAALTHERREELEAGLYSGDLRGVWSTNALELGVDVGGLDAVILDGYPGTRMNTFQQAGRAGRGDDPALVVLVAGEDQLDQYVMQRPDELFDGPPEQAVSNPENDQLLPRHVQCAARENWLDPDDDAHFGDTFPDVVASLTDDGLLERTTSGDGGVRWTYAGGGSPQHETSLRTIDDREVDLVDARSGDVVASLPFADALRDAHEGAIYHQQGQSYEVVDLDLGLNRAELSPTWADYYTRTLYDKTITVEEDHRARPLEGRSDVDVTFATVEMRKQITGYQRRDSRSGEVLAEETLALPETSLRTKGLYVTVPQDVEERMRAAAARREREGAASADFDGGIHAAEHALISMYPTELLCDRRDVGGLSTPLHPHTGEPTVFVYDGHPGGVGLNRAAYDRLEDLLERTLGMLVDCDCRNGCPACVQSPQCGNANDPLDKHLGAHLLAALAYDGRD
jgi:DEAD/DEAH box helicase domain-containing protein